MSGSNPNMDNSLSVSEKDEIIEKRGLKEKKFSYFEPAKGITFAVVATVLFLGFPQVITYVFIGALIPIFDATVVRSLWIPIILWALFRIGIEVVYIIEKKYTKRLATFTIVGDILATICGLIIFVSPRILWQGYIDFVHTYFDDMAAWFTVPLTRILDRPNLIILFVMILVFVIECINVVRRSGRKEEKDDDDNINIDEVKAETIEAQSEAEQV